MDRINVTVTGLDHIRARLEELPDAVGNDGVEAADNYLLNILISKEIPPYRYVSRRQAYGRTFFSDRQRRFVMAGIRSGKITIPYKRGGKTSGIQSQWKIIGTGKSAYLENDAPGAIYLYSEMQANQPRLVGWKRIETIVDAYTKKIGDAFERGARKAIRRLGLD